MRRPQNPIERETCPACFYGYVRGVPQILQARTIGAPPQACPAPNVPATTSACSRHAPAVCLLARRGRSQRPCWRTCSCTPSTRPRLPRQHRHLSVLGARPAAACSRPSPTRNSSSRALRRRWDACSGTAPQCRCVCQATCTSTEAVNTEPALLTVDAMASRFDRAGTGGSPGAGTVPDTGSEAHPGQDGKIIRR